MAKKRRQGERDNAQADMLASSTQPEISPPATPEIPVDPNKAPSPEIAPPSKQAPEIETPPAPKPDVGAPPSPKPEIERPEQTPIRPEIEPAPSPVREPPSDPTKLPAHDPSPRTPGPEVPAPASPPEYAPVQAPEFTPPSAPDVSPGVPSAEPPRASFRAPPPRNRLSRVPPPAEPARASNTPLPGPRPSIPARPTPPRISLEPGTEITGELLRQLREQRGITLKEIEDVTRVRAASLMAVEAERFDELPHVKIYVKGFVQSLARWIGVDPELAATSYLHRWERWRERTPAPKRHFIK